MARPPLIPIRDMRLVFTAALEAHKTREERAALRAGLEGSVAICDMIARKIEGDHLRGGSVTKRGRKMAEAVRATADTIMALQDSVGSA